MMYALLGGLAGSSMKEALTPLMMAKLEESQNEAAALNTTVSQLQAQVMKDDDVPGLFVAWLKDLNLDQLTTALRSDRDAAEQLSTWSQTFTVSNLIDTTRPDAARSAVKCGAVIVALLKLFFANHGQGLR